MQNSYTGPGRGVTVPKIPTPTLNTVKRSEIVVHPAKGTNNLESIKNNQTSNQVYLDKKEKNQNKSITSNDFSRQSVAIDSLKEKSETKEEYDEEVTEEVNEAIRTIERVYTMGDGTMNIRRCRKYIEQIKGIEEIFRGIREAVEESEVVENGQNGTNPVFYQAELDKTFPVEKTGAPTLSVGAVTIVDSTTRAPIIQPTEQTIGWVAGCPGDYERRMTPRVITRQEHYCHIAGKIAERCRECERERDISYCIDKCETCKREKKLMEQSKDQIHKKIYVEKEKERMIRIMEKEVPRSRATAIIPPVPGDPTLRVGSMNNISTVATLGPVVRVPIKAEFNRIGNFVDKFLAVTYTAADTDVIKVEGETRWKRMENIERQLGLICKQQLGM
jgi:hypothetical protein